MIRITAFLLLLTHVLSALPFNPKQRYSDQFYAAQKCFYREALKKLSKLNKEKAYPEIPLTGGISREELARINALNDVPEARRQFANEVNKYPELLYPEIFQFLYNHPALQVSSSNKSKFEAIEQYFSGFNFLFCSDRYYYFHPTAKANPCPLVYVYSDPKKNQISLSLGNNSKTGLSLLMSENLFAERLNYTGKSPIALKAGGSSQVKLLVNVQELQKDSNFRVINIALYDPAQPKIKLMVPVILLPSPDFLKAGAQFFDLQYSYSSHLKNIDLYSERSSGPEPCGGNNCSGKKQISNRQSNRFFETYNFGEAGSVQFHLLSFSSWPYNPKKSRLQIIFNEMGELQGKARDCPGPVPNSTAPCPRETASNGKELYGTRKLELNCRVPVSRKGELSLSLNFSEAESKGPDDPVISWLSQKKLMVLLLDEEGKELHKEILKNHSLQLQKSELPAGLYTLSIFPVTEDQPKHNSSFEIKYLNQAARARFDFQLTADLSLSVY